MARAASPSPCISVAVVYSDVWWMPLAAAGAGAVADYAGKRAWYSHLRGEGLTPAEIAGGAGGGGAGSGSASAFGNAGAAAMQPELQRRQQDNQIKVATIQANAQIESARLASEARDRQTQADERVRTEANRLRSLVDSNPALQRELNEARRGVSQGILRGAQELFSELGYDGPTAGEMALYLATVLVPGGMAVGAGARFLGPAVLRLLQRSAPKWRALLSSDARRLKKFDELMKHNSVSASQYVREARRRNWDPQGGPINPGVPSTRFRQDVSKLPPD